LFNKPIREALRNGLSHCRMHEALLKRRTPFGIGGLGIGDLEPPPRLEPLSEPSVNVFRATPLCAPPNLSRTIGERNALCSNGCETDPISDQGILRSRRCRM
jgi:hypothetical protein